MTSYTQHDNQSLFVSESGVVRRGDLVGDSIMRCVGAVYIFPPPAWGPSLNIAKDWRVFQKKKHQNGCDESHNRLFVQREKPLAPLCAIFGHVTTPAWESL